MVVVVWSSPSAPKGMGHELSGNFKHGTQFEIEAPKHSPCKSNVFGGGPSPGYLEELSEEGAVLETFVVCEEQSD